MAVEQHVVSDQKVKIVVSCHQEFPIPAADVYLPVHVGAQNAKAPLPGMQPDNDGENISDRNFTFCELSAQYWAWKNLEADYIGQCHYRRYFCFEETDLEANDHAQLEARTLSDVAIRELGLDNGEKIKEEVAKADITTGHWWDVRGVRTPRGASRNVAEHMVSYGLFTDNDLRVLREIVAERQPDYLEDLDAYLDGDKYLGYNCFVMRRAAFEELCSFEFDVLLEFDRRKDYAGLTRNQRRICGYMGEVLYSVFIMRVRRLGTYSIQERPLVFFGAADLGLTIVNKGAAGEKNTTDDLVQIVWNASTLYYQGNWSNSLRMTLTDALPLSLAVCLKSLFACADPKKRYRISLFVPDQFMVRRFNVALGPVPENVTINTVTWIPSAGRGFLSQLDDVQRMDLLPVLLPWLYPAADARLLWLDGLAVFHRDPAEALAGYGAGTGITATSGIRFEREFARPGSFGDVDEGWRRVFKTFADSRFAVVDLADSRVRWSLDEVRNVVEAPGFEKFSLSPRNESSACDALMSALGAAGLPYEVASPSLVTEDVENWASAESLDEWQGASAPAVVLFDDSPIPAVNVDFNRNIDFWNAARDANCYEHLLVYAGMGFSAVGTERLRDRLLPAGSKRREMAGRVFRIIKDGLRQG